MGTFIHKSLTVFGDPGLVETAHERATKVKDAAERIGELGPVVTDVVQVNNGSATFAILPEGSKAGWPRNQNTEQAIEEVKDFVEYALAHMQECDGTITAVETTFGETGFKADLVGYYRENA